MNCTARVVFALCEPSALILRMFLFLAGILIAMGYVIAHWFSGTFSLAAWLGGLTLFVFAWIGRFIATGEASARSTY